MNEMQIAEQIVSLAQSDRSKARLLYSNLIKLLHSKGKLSKFQNLFFKLNKNFNVFDLIIVYGKALNEGIKDDPFLWEELGRFYCWAGLLTNNSVVQFLQLGQFCLETARDMKSTNGSKVDYSIVREIELCKKLQNNPEDEEGIRWQTAGLGIETRTSKDIEENKIEFPDFSQLVPHPVVSELRRSLREKGGRGSDT